MPTRKNETTELTFERVQVERIQVAIMGSSPIILNRMSAKAQQQLLLPAPRKNAAARAASLKHDPYAEFKAAPYTFAERESATLLALPATAIKGALMTAALDLPGASKAQIGRLLYVEGEMLPLYGEPQLLMSITRSADINHTPDIRTRAIVPYWATVCTIRYVVPLLRQSSVFNLLVAAGVTAGVGDWRPEKGRGGYGAFEVTNMDNEDFIRCLTQGRSVQEKAMAEPEPYNAETEELLAWFDAEYLRRTGAPMAVANGAIEEEDLEGEELEVVV